MLLDGSNLGVDGRDGSAEDGRQADSASVALEGTVHESGSHTINITSSLGVGERLIRSGLLEAVYRTVSKSSFISTGTWRGHTSVSDLALASGTSSIAQQTEDGVLNLVGIILLQGGVDSCDELLPGVLVGNLTLAHAEMSTTVVDWPSSGGSQEQSEGADH
jgi:hypothetical protein